MTPLGTALKPEDGGRCGDCQISLGFSEFNLKDLVIIAPGVAFLRESNKLLHSR